ncbi:hypothetical protein CRG98_008669 [Punica granatum]|uniref:Uncharacterized protein n=1 Tax=Punica granatum TaxID=22663 RepID=A0A2I0KSW4_PUNGR|nr:hypothetical protein CRG98_008669 [Punica granatum]
MVIPSPEMRDGTFKSQTWLEYWTDPTGTSQVRRRHGGFRWNFGGRSAALGSQGTPLGDRGGRLFPELSGRPVQSCKNHRKQSTFGNWPDWAVFGSEFITMDSDGIFEQGQRLLTPN